MKNARLLSTVAATLLLTVGIASAQNSRKDEAPAPAPAAQQNAPAEKIAPSMKAGTIDAETHKPATAGQAGPKELAPGHGQNVEPRMGAGNSRGPKGNAKDGAAPKGSSDANGSATTGQGAAAGAAKLSAEQRGKIATALRRHKVEPAHLTVSPRIGFRVPDSVQFYPLPQDVYVIYPEWRGYDYILVGNEILVIDPNTHEIVAILDA